MLVRAGYVLARAGAACRWGGTGPVSCHLCELTVLGLYVVALRGRIVGRFRAMLLSTDVVFVGRVRNTYSRSCMLARIPMLVSQLPEPSLHKIAPARILRELDWGRGRLRGGLVRVYVNSLPNYHAQTVVIIR